MTIRPAAKEDSKDVEDIYLSAFPQGECEIIAELAVNLLSEKTTSPVISLLAVQDDDAVGHIAYSPVKIDNEENWKGYILAPLAVKPAYQKRNIGSRLIKHGIKDLSDKGTNMLFVYGDPEYYSRFGFGIEAAAGYTPPYDLEYPSGWQAVVLNEFNSTKTRKKISCVNALYNSKLW